jgi:hypothetical protein
VRCWLVARCSQVQEKKNRKQKQVRIVHGKNSARLPKSSCIVQINQDQEREKYQATSIYVQKLQVSQRFQQRVTSSCPGNSKKIFRLRCSDNLKEKLRLLRLQDRQLRLVTLGGSPPRARANYRQRSGARHQLAPECRKSSQDLRFHRHQQRDDPNSTRGLDNNFASDSGCDSTTTNSPTSTSSTTPRQPHRTR